MSPRLPGRGAALLSLSVVLPVPGGPAAIQEAPPPCQPFVGCAGEPETLDVESDGGSWRVGYVRREPVPMTEWVPDGETVHDRTRMLTFLWFSEYPAPEDAERRLRGRMEDRCGDAVQWTVLESTGDMILYEWILRDCRGSEDQHVVARISRGAVGSHYVFLTAHGPPLPDSLRDDWVRRLRSARPAPGGRAPARADSPGEEPLPVFEETPGPPDSASWEPRHSTPGVTLRMVEAGRRKQGGSTLVGYGFEAEGVPEGRVFRLLMWSSGTQVQTLLDGLTATRSGHLVCTDPTLPEHAFWRCEAQKLEDLRIGVFKQVRGEATRTALVSRDGSVRAFARAVPFPLVATDGACRLELESLHPDYGTFIAWGAGFPPGERARLELGVGRQTSEFVPEADARGRFHVRLSPRRPGKKGGEATVRATAPGCQPELEFDWGDRAARQR